MFTLCIKTDICEGMDISCKEETKDLLIWLLSLQILNFKIFLQHCLCGN